jgi:hypothetical protein
MGRPVLTLDEEPAAREAIRLYTDPLLPTFGKKKASAGKAGFESPAVFERLAVKEEIKRILAERAEASNDVVKYLSTYTMDAARELVSQLSVGRELEIMEVEFELGDKHAVAQVRHNKTVLDAAKERRAAAVELIRYQIGTPEQRIRVTKEEEPTPLDDLSDDQLEELGSAIGDTLSRRRPALAEVIEEETD